MNRKFLFSIVYFPFITVIQPHLFLFLKLNLILPKAKNILAVVITITFSKQSEPGAWMTQEALILDSSLFVDFCSSQSCLLSYWFQSSHTPEVIIQPWSQLVVGLSVLFPLQVKYAFSLQINYPLLFSQLLSSYLWAEPGAWDYSNIWPPASDPPS